jgi:hypothetical protein
MVRKGNLRIRKESERPTKKILPGFYKGSAKYDL